MVECPFCGSQYVPNTPFCNECGMYLLEHEEIATNSIEPEEPVSLSGLDRSKLQVRPRMEPLTIRLRVCPGSSLEGESSRPREWEIRLVKPIRLGRVDPSQDIYPDIDLTADQGVRHGVSRNHARIFGWGKLVMLEDLGSTNGTQLNGKRIAPYLPETLSDGDQLQLGKLLIEVHFVPRHPAETPTNKAR